MGNSVGIVEPEPEPEPDHVTNYINNEKSGMKYPIGQPHPLNNTEITLQYTSKKPKLEDITEIIVKWREIANSRGKFNLDVPVFWENNFNIPSTLSSGDTLRLKEPKAQTCIYKGTEEGDDDREFALKVFTGTDIFDQIEDLDEDDEAESENERSNAIFSELYNWIVISRKERDEIRSHESWVVKIDMLHEFVTRNAKIYYGVSMEYFQINLSEFINGDLKRISLAQEYKEPTKEMITRQLISAMKWLHSQKVLHGNIKPGHVLISQDMYMTQSLVVKLTDFRESIIDDDEKTAPVIEFNDKCMRYSPGYRAFELLGKFSPLVVTSVFNRYKCDSFAMGMTLRELWGFKYTRNTNLTEIDEFVTRFPFIPQSLFANVNQWSGNDRPAILAAYEDKIKEDNEYYTSRDEEGNPAMVPLCYVDGYEKITKLLYGLTRIDPRERLDANEAYMFIENRGMNLRDPRDKYAIDPPVPVPVSNQVEAPVRKEKWTSAIIKSFQAPREMNEDDIFNRQLAKEFGLEQLYDVDDPVDPMSFYTDDQLYDLAEGHALMERMNATRGLSETHVNVYEVELKKRHKQ